MSIDIQPIAPLRTALTALVQAVSGIGNVYDYMRHPVSEAEVKTLFVTGGGTPRLHYWCVTLAPDDKFVEQRFPSSHSKAWVTFAIRGYYALQDSVASEKTFIDLVESVLNSLRSNKTLSGAALQSGPARWTGPTHVEVVNVLCHYAELIVPVYTAVEC